MPNNQIACQVSSLSPKNRSNRAKLVKELLKVVKGTKELNNGYAFRYPLNSETFLNVAKFIDFERRCCPFFTFQVKINPGDESIWLQLTGPQDVKNFLQSHEDFAV